MKKAIKYILIICAFSFSSFAEEITSLSDLPDIKEKITPEIEKITEKTPVTAVQEKEKPSNFELFIKGEKEKTISTDLQQFGYNLFEQAPSTFAPVDIVPISPDYVLGPDDEINITLWGAKESRYNLKIDREGKISAPIIGVIELAGLTFSEAKKFIANEFGRYFKPSEVKINISMGSLRSMRIFAVGNVKKPGSYTISSLSTLINALFASGGPSKVGSMRSIQIKRKDEIIVNFDLYDFLLAGNKSKDIKLMPEDVVFVPPVGVLVGIAGNVKVPAIYELKDETRLLDLIQMAGGFTAYAFKGRVQVERIIDNKLKKIFEGDLIDIEKDQSKNFILQDGDLVKIYSIVDTKNTMTVSGAVVNSGEYGVTQGITKIKDVIFMSGGLVYYSAEEAELTRLKVTQNGPETKRFVINIAKALKDDPIHNITLEVNDYLFVRTVPGWQLHKTVTISGEVKFPGIYTITKNEKLFSLLERAGGYTDKAYLKGTIFTRESVRTLQQKQLDDAIDRLEQQILSQGAATVETAITAESGALKAQAIEQRRALIAKMRTAKAQGRIAISLGTLDKFKDTSSDIALEEGDAIIIPEAPTQVHVIGSVYNQTAFVYDNKAKVSTYLKKAGGMTSGADEDELFVLKIDGTAVSDREVNGFFTQGLKSHKLDPGDTIVVPEKVERIAWLREIKDITQIIFQLAVTTGVVVALF
jgi:protein involved in polysaccharide export with SLBB domain